MQNLTLPCPLAVDDLEHPWLIEQFSKMGATVQRLHVADYAWRAGKDLALIQRKSISDAVTSVKDGTLGPQAIMSMQQAAKWVFLLLELESGCFDTSVLGYIKMNGKVTHFSFIALIHYLVSLQRFGYLLYISPDLSQTPTAITTLMSYTLERMHSSIYRPVQKLKDAPATFSTLLTIPNVNVNRAEALVKDYGSLMELSQASAKELQDTKGIGPKTAKSIFNHFRTYLR